MSEPRDRGAYRLAIGAIGLALVVLLAGICVVLAFGPTTCNSGCEKILGEIPSGLLKIAGALAGGLLGLLMPAPTTMRSTGKSAETGGGEFKRTIKEEAAANLTVVALLIVFVVSLGFGIAAQSTGLQSLAAASGAALLGLQVPTPATADREDDSHW
jgi:hypothetical protein